MKKFTAPEMDSLLRTLGLRTFTPERYDNKVNKQLCKLY